MTEQETEQQHRPQAATTQNELDPIVGVMAMNLSREEKLAQLTISDRVKDSALTGALKEGDDVEKYVIERLEQKGKNQGSMRNAANRQTKWSFKVTGPIVVLVAILASYLYLEANPGLRDSITRSYEANPAGWEFLILAAVIAAAALYWKFGRKGRH